MMNALDLTVDSLEAIEAPLSDMEWGVASGIALAVGVAIGIALVT